MSLGSKRPFASLVAVMGAASLLMSAGPAEATGRGHDWRDKKDLEIHVLSGRADTVTGGNALVRINVPRGVRLQDVRVTLNRHDITGAFIVNESVRTLTGLVTGLDLGNNRLEVQEEDHRRGREPKARITLIDYPIEGPVFSGPHQQPFICETQNFNVPVIGGNLGPALDANCSIATRVDYFYRTTAGGFAPWPAGTSTYPSDLAQTTNTLGVSVPYIIRMETGTVNRSIYQTTILHDPLAEPTPNFHTKPRGWNGRLIYTFGGGCINGWYRQGRGTGGVTDNFMLSSGYAVASASLNVFGNNCSDLTAAETMMMVKERFIETYGPVRHTQGFGCSGGSYQQHQIADNYPGLLDGIIPGCSFPEVGFATISFITDAWLIDNYFNARAGLEWTAEQKRLVTGFGVYNTAPNVAVGARRIDPRVFCGVVPVEQRYDPVTNPTGVRCDVFDHTVNVYGTDRETGFARRPLDNVGIQYGLEVLNDGLITVDQFLDLNENIGGFDDDANILPPGQRTQGDTKAMRAAYRTGRLTNGGGGLHEIPIIDYRGYNDEVPNGDIHVRYHTFSMRERIRKANGTAANHVSVVEDNRFGLYSTNSPLLRRMILTLDRWITAINEDSGPGSKFEKVVRNKPADLKEGCNTRDASPTFIAQKLDRDPDSTCEQLYPSYSFPREVAGADVAADIVKCRLKPVSWRDYDVPFSSAQWARLKEIFPTGVCDWSRKGVEQRDLAGTWISFGGN